MPLDQPLQVLASSILTLTLLVLALIDFRTFRLPDLITLPLMMAGLGFNYFYQPGFTSFDSALVGVVLGFGFLWGVNLLYRLLKKQDGIGLGDAKLLAALGAWLGWQALPDILLLAALMGLVGGWIWLRWQRLATSQAFPFGPFLAFAGIIALLWPNFLLLPSRLLST
ncbi:A24 family peptidase [Polynucleobacter sp. IMCC30063]|uniref:prepilin peptidase n=1 Tax=unclassified Polynucleobacter TaxID=2640945 RepID=UPI001F201B94|nr:MULTISPECIES: A24 family peptidase [unclassified Polynucleobacter]MCE7505061.1 A24 family peptidase [Polynucleobacter sp. IMCC30063]MCE7528454.1 A24 family peptidase [Polynucleobacter sp. IMCC 29146]